MEMTVITVILILIAATIVPNVVEVLNSEQLKADEAMIARLPDKVRNDAVRNQNPVRLRFDGNSIIEEEVEVNDVTQQLSQVKLGNSIQVDQVQLNYANADPSSWNWTAYPDGTSDAGGIQVSIDSEVRSLVIPTTGESAWTTGPLPDESLEQWTAGPLLQRST
jgi:Tfp pilus assembly protein FimT